ncbi:phage holin [Desulfitobacterium sp.]|uniref:phage holin n=1 Tax=Desulfitobacterium sp. TaxID=49981 RepID=UPI002B21F056|nr:phage holin [Desulfitobacterium sp.]MEA4901837.1 phage holin [Desulfitobacterium sp.]
MFDATPILEALALLVAAVITAVVIPYIKSKTTSTQQQEINSWVKVAVLAAEQIFNGSGRGAEKKAYVLNFLAEHGIKLDEARVDALIEAAVFEMKNGIIKSN